MKRLNQRSCTEFSGTLPKKIASTTFMTIAAMFTIGWNWMNFLNIHIYRSASSDNLHDRSKVVVQDDDI